MKFLTDILIGSVVVVTLFFVYQTYGGSLKATFFGDENMFTVYIDTVAMTVTVADSESERKQGLSEVVSLEEFEGKLFVFDSAQRHGIWMKNMLLPIDIMWFDNNLELIYFQENVDPSTYPTVFAPTQDARFVIEANAHFIDALHVQIGDRLLLPSTILPADIRNSLQQ